MNPPEIPQQITSGNVCPCNPKGKGDYFISQKKIFDIAQYLKIDSETINPNSWSEKNGAVYVSWKGFHNLPKPIQKHFIDLEFKKGLDFGIKTGKQQDRRFIIVFDCDDERASEYKDFIINVYGDTFIRKTPSGAFHVYYESLNGSILKNNMHIDLRHYITIDDKPMDMEVKPGSFVKEIGYGRTTYSNLPIKKVNFENIDFIQNVQWSFPGWKLIKEFNDTENSNPHINDESLKVLDSELLDILNKKYLPAYISPEIKGHRENTIIPATFGFLIKRNMPRSQMEDVLKWINNVAEFEKPGISDHRNYNFDNIPDVLAGSGVLIKYGFDNFVNAINDLSGYISKRQTQKVLGEHTINTVSLEYPTDHLPMFETLQDIVGIHSQSHKHILKMIYYSMVSCINPKTIVYLHGAKHDLRISTIFVGKQGQGKTEILKTTANILEGIGLKVHRPTSFHSEQWIGKTRTDKKAENGVTQIMGYLYDDVIIIDEAKRLISDPDFAETRRTARISQNRYMSSPVEKKNVDTHNKDKISYYSKSVLLYGVQDMKLDAEDFIVEGDVRRYAISVLDNETMDSQEKIIRSVMEEKREYISHHVFSDYLNKIPRLPDEVFIKLGSEERVLYERVVINLNDRANSYSKMVSEYFGTLGAEYLTLFLKFVVNYSLVRMVDAGIVSQNIKITKEDILYAYVDCFEMLEHRYEWTHFYLVMESALVHKGAKYLKEIEVLSSFDMGQPIHKGDILTRIKQVYSIQDKVSRNTLKKYIQNGFIKEINNHTVEIRKLPGKRVKRKDDLSIEMYNHALAKINNIKTKTSKKQNIKEPSDWDLNEPVEVQSELSN